MQKKFSAAILTTFAIAVGALAGCSTVQDVKAYAKDAIMLPASEIGAPIAAPAVVRADDAAEASVTRATTKVVKSMLRTLEQPISLTAPITIHRFVSMNPEILSTNAFGVQLAGEVGTSLAADGYTLQGQGKKDPAPKVGAIVRGSYVQRGRSLTVSVWLLDATEKTTLSFKTFTLPIDGALRQLLDR